MTLKATFYTDYTNRPLCVRIPGQSGCSIGLSGLKPKYHEPGVEAGKCASCDNPLTPTQAVKFRLERMEHFLTKAARKKRLDGDLKAANRADAFRVAVREKRISLQRRSFNKIDAQSLRNQALNYGVLSTKTLPSEELQIIDAELAGL